MLFKRFIPGDKENQKQCVSFMEPNARGDTPLHLAVREGHAEVVNLFLAKRQLSSQISKVMSELVDIATAKNRMPVLAALSAHAGSPLKTEDVSEAGISPHSPLSHTASSESPAHQSPARGTPGTTQTSPLSEFWSSSPRSPSDSPSMLSPASMSDVQTQNPLSPLPRSFHKQAFI